MDQQTARKLYEEGAIFIFLDVPEGTEFGIDMKSWSTGEKFRGVKMIPPGIHYIFYSPVSETGDSAPRIGFLHHFKKSEVLVKKWDKENESISSETISEDEVVRLKDNLKVLDAFLGPYPYDIRDRWSSLTSNITENILRRLLPLSGYVQSALELEPCSDADRPRGSKHAKTNAGASGSSKDVKRKRLSDKTEDTYLPHLKPKEGTELRLTSFPEKNYPDGSTPSEITQHCLDSTYVLDIILGSLSSPIEILGEIELCYICFLVGHSLEAFEQWKKLVCLLCSCKTAIKKHRKVYDLFISLIDIQIQEIPEEFLADIVTNNNFVYAKLRQLFGTIETLDIDGQLKTKVERLKKSLTELYQWDFGHLDSDEEDEAPVIVET